MLSKCSITELHYQPLNDFLLLGKLCLGHMVTKDTWVLLLQDLEPFFGAFAPNKKMIECTCHKLINNPERSGTVPCEHVLKFLTGNMDYSHFVDK
jgi:hypothetical protein